jgi:hypothetical protein
MPPSLPEKFNKEFTFCFEQKLLKSWFGELKTDIKKPAPAENPPERAKNRV